MVLARKSHGTNEEETKTLFDLPQADEARRLETGERAVKFILAGKAKITLRSIKTGKHYTYKIKKGEGAFWYVSRLTANNDYLYLGTIFDTTVFRTTRKTSGYAHYSEGWTAFDWFWRRLIEDQAIPPGVELYHAGRCGMCGLELTDPVSIKEGYGPDCRKKELRHGFLRDRTSS